MRFIYTKGFAVFFAVLALAVLAAFSHYKGWLGPVQQAFLQLPRPINFLLNGAARPVKNFFSTAFRLREIADENARLSEQVLKLQNRQVLFDGLSLENERLRKELKFAQSSKLDLQPCSVVGRSAAGLADTVTVNCGSAQGSAVGKAVVADGFLAGKVSYTEENFSAVQLITNAGFSVDARISQGGKVAIARGSFNSGLVLDQIAQDEPVQRGQLAVTAGVDDRIAKNLLIGEIGEVLSAPNDLFKRASLLSPIDFGNLDFVFLVK